MHPSGHPIRDPVVDGACSFADLSTLRLSRFARLEPDWAEREGGVKLAGRSCRRVERRRALVISMRTAKMCRRVPIGCLPSAGGAPNRLRVARV